VSVVKTWLLLNRNTLLSDLLLSFGSGYSELAQRLLLHANPSTEVSLHILIHLCR
jgi:hypothetical protein